MTNGQECSLLITKINRLFRTLRSKCTALATTSQHKGSTVVTFSNPCYQVTGRIAEAANPPLVVLPRPENIISLHKTDVEKLQFSKRIYEVCDTFKNILQAAFGANKILDTQKPPRIPSLATICAAAIGHELESHAQAIQEQSERGNIKDTVTMKTVEDIYDSIPLHHRSHAVVSHALSLILETCPSDHTLLSVLLDHTLAYKLQEHSSILLREILTSCVRPNSSANIYPLCHPIHFDYLVTLRHTCCNPLPSANRFRFTDRAFTRIFVDALLDAADGAVDLWTCKAVTRFARDTLRSDFTAFMYICAGAAKNLPISKSSATPKKRSRHKRLTLEKSLPPDNRLPDQLVAWLCDLIPYLTDISRHQDEDLRAVISFLSDTMSTHSFRIGHPELADAILCIATLCLSSPLYSTLPSDEKGQLKNVLHQASVRSESYDKLVLSALSDPHIPSSSSQHQTPSQASSLNASVSWNVLPCSAAVDAIREVARPLRARSFHRLEAALWSSTLRNVEATYIRPRSGMTEGGGSSRDIMKLRRELVELVERAERRCFGAGREQGHGVSSSHATGDPEAARTLTRERDVSTSANGEDGSEWEWEDMVGTWVRKTPRSAIVATSTQESSKKRKFRDRDERTSGRFDGAGESRRTSIPEHFVSSRIPTKSSKESARKNEVTRTPREHADEDVDVDTRAEPRRKRVLHESKIANSLKHVEILHPPQPPRPLYATQQHQQQRRSLSSLFPRDFESKLANALRNVEVLHPKRLNVAQPRPQPQRVLVARPPHSRTLDLDRDGDEETSDGSGCDDDSDNSPTSTARSSVAWSNSGSASTARTEVPEEDDLACDVAAGDHLSSDDTLNLFAYGSES